MRELVIAVAVAAVVSGCSFAVVRGEPPRCTTSAAPPIIDTALTAALAAAAVRAKLRLADLGPPPPDGDHSGERKVESLKFSLSLVAGVIFAASAVYGYVRTARCRAAEGAAK